MFSQENVWGFRQEGIASWYGIEYAGKATASGELFNPDDMTAAHPKLPFGTFLRVTNTHNGKQVIVRVNDRGPFVAARIIDLSQSAAEQLDMVITGTAPVIVEQVDLLPQNNNASALTQNIESVPAVQNQVPPPQNQNQNRVMQDENLFTQIETIPVKTNPDPVRTELLQNIETAPSAIIVNPGMPPAGSGKLYRIQVGSYRNAKYAVDAFTVLKEAGLTPAYERYNDLYRVVLAQIASNNVQSVIDTLANAGFKEVLIKEEL
jgi:rare lipoprotein A